MQNSAKLSGFLLAFALLAGCVMQPDAGKNPASGEFSFSVRTVTYESNNAEISALLCEPNGTDAQTMGIVLTGGDGVTAEKLRPACEAFAKNGFLVLAHGNVENGTAGQNIEAVVKGAEYLRTSDATKTGVASATRPIALWGHSAGTIFSAFAGFDPSVKPFAFIDTSGHMQIPICDAPGSPSPSGGACLAYWSQFKAPIMIVHGMNDTVVDVSFAQAFSDRLSTIGKFHRLLRVPNAGHEFMLDRPGVLDVEAAFLDEEKNAETE